MSSPRNFLYRFPRFEANNRVDFIYGDNILLGCCLEISESGLRCTFSNAALAGTEGLITLYSGDESFSAHALVLNVQEDEATVRFEFHSQREETAVREFIKMLSSRPQP